MNSRQEEIYKQRIQESDKTRLMYKRSLNKIKDEYNIEFDIEHFQNELIKIIKFVDLNNKSDLKNLEIIYNNVSKKIDYISYDFTNGELLKRLDHRKIIPTLDKEFNLTKIIEKIVEANLAFVRRMETINKKYKGSNENR